MCVRTCFSVCIVMVIRSRSKVQPGNSPETGKPEGPNPKSTGGAKPENREGQTRNSAPGPNPKNPRSETRKPRETKPETTSTASTTTTATASTTTARTATTSAATTGSLLCSTPLPASSFFSSSSAARRARSGRRRKEWSLILSRGFPGSELGASWRAPRVGEGGPAQTQAIRADLREFRIVVFFSTYSPSVARTAGKSADGLSRVTAYPISSSRAPLSISSTQRKSADGLSQWVV